MSTPISAPGKAFLFGEYAVLEGSPAWLSAVNVRAVAHVKRPEDESYSGPTHFLDAAISEADAFLRTQGWTELNAPPLPPICISTVGFTAGSRKLGLGSSAAVTAAAAGFRLRAAGLNLNDPALKRELLALAQRAHRKAQKGHGSGADVIASVLGGSVRVENGEATPTKLPASMELSFVDAGAPASTESFVRQAFQLKERNPEAYFSALDAIRRGAALFEAIVGTGNASSFELSQLIEATRLHNDGLRQLDKHTGSEILPPSILKIIELATDFGLAAKPSGAGGGDLVAIFSDDRAKLDRFTAHIFRKHGIASMCGLEVEAPGVREEHRPPVSSRLSGFFRLGVGSRREKVAAMTGIEVGRFEDAGPHSLALETADHMIENVIGTMALPMAVATNFRINGRDYLVPMCVEEASVVAAASNAAKMIREGGGFFAHSDPPWMIAQIQLVKRAGSPPAEEIVPKLEGNKEALLELADQAHPRLVARGGGAREIELRILDADNVVIHVLVDCRDAMGANLLNTVAETLAPRVSEMTSWQPRLRILSNLADRRASHVSARVPVGALASKHWTGEQAIEGIVQASRFAELDPYRAATHNKGIMNGSDAVVLATGNDWRAMEAAAHAYATRKGRYEPLAIWRKAKDGSLLGEISLPTALGVVGGATRSHPSARLALDILGSPSGIELGQIVAAAGLASNLAALKALATEGIQRGHMTLHARSVAISAGAKKHEIEALAARIVEIGEIKVERATDLLKEIRETNLS